MFLLLLLQDPVEHLIERLESRDPRERDRAEADLIAAGEKALPALKRAMEYGSLEARERAASAYHAVLWNSAGPAEVPEELRRVLRRPIAQAWTDPGDSPLYELLEAFQGPVPRAKASRLPWAEGPSPLEHVDARAFTDVGYALSKDERWRYWRARAGGRVLCATAPIFDEYPRFLYLSGEFDPTQRREPPSKILRIESREEIRPGGRVAAVLTTFTWDQKEPRANLRYLLVSERFAIYCVSYRP